MHTPARRQLLRRIRISVPALASLGIGCGLYTFNPLPPVADTDDYKSFYIAEQNFYGDGSDCNQYLNGLPVVTDNLKTLLSSHGWFGVRASDHTDDCDDPTKKCAETTDFVDNTRSWFKVGEDHLWADTNTFAMYAGASRHNQLSFRREKDGFGNGTACFPFLHDQVRLGYNTGAEARVTAFASPCVGYASDLLSAEWDAPTDFWRALGRSNSWQYLAYFDEPILSASDMTTFFNLMNQGRSNYYAWTYGTEYSTTATWNQPIVYTLYSLEVDPSEDYVRTRHESGNLLTGEHFPQPAAAQGGRLVYWTHSVYDGDPALEHDPDPSTCVSNIPFSADGTGADETADT